MGLFGLFANPLRAMKFKELPILAIRSYMVRISRLLLLQMDFCPHWLALSSA